MSDKCPYYFMEEHIFRSKEVGGDRTPAKPIRAKTPRCTHPEAKNPAVMPPVNCPCEGDIAKCVIPGIW